jgi:hypothetical protein
MTTQQQPFRPFSRLDYNNIEEIAVSKQQCFAGIPQKNKEPSKPFPHF